MRETRIHPSSRPFTISSPYPFSRNWRCMVCVNWVSLHLEARFFVTWVHQLSVSCWLLAESLSKLAACWLRPLFTSAPRTSNPFDLCTFTLRAWLTEQSHAICDGDVRHHTAIVHDVFLQRGFPRFHASTSDCDDTRLMSWTRSVSLWLLLWFLPLYARRSLTQAPAPQHLSSSDMFFTVWKGIPLVFCAKTLKSCSFILVTSAGWPRKSSDVSPWMSCQFLGASSPRLRSNMRETALSRWHRTKRFKRVMSPTAVHMKPYSGCVLSSAVFEDRRLLMNWASSLLTVTQYKDTSDRIFEVSALSNKPTVNDMREWISTTPPRTSARKAPGRHNHTSLFSLPSGIETSSLRWFTTIGWKPECPWITTQMKTLKSTGASESSRWVHLNSGKTTTVAVQLRSKPHSNNVNDCSTEILRRVVRRETVCRIHGTWDPSNFNAILLKNLLRPVETRINLLWLYICSICLNRTWREYSTERNHKDVMILSLLYRYLQQVRKMRTTRIVSTNFRFRHNAHEWKLTVCTN